MVVALESWRRFVMSDAWRIWLDQNDLFRVERTVQRWNWKETKVKQWQRREMIFNLTDRCGNNEWISDEILFEFDWWGIQEFKRERQREDDWIEWKEYLWSPRLDAMLIDNHWWLVQFELEMNLIWHWSMMVNVWRFDVDFVFDEEMMRDEVILTNIFTPNRSMEIEVMKWHNEFDWRLIRFHLNGHWIGVEYETFGCRKKWRKVDLIKLLNGIDCPAKGWSRGFVTIHRCCSTFLLFNGRDSIRRSVGQNDSRRNSIECRTIVDVTCAEWKSGGWLMMEFVFFERIFDWFAALHDCCSTSLDRWYLSLSQFKLTIRTACNWKGNTTRWTFQNEMKLENIWRFESLDRTLLSSTVAEIVEDFVSRHQIILHYLNVLGEDGLVHRPGFNGMNIGISISTNECFKRKFRARALNDERKRRWFCITSRRKSK